MYVVMEIKKSRKASLESKRGLFFKLGLLFSVTAVFCSFELKFYGLETSDLGDIDWIEEDEIEFEFNQVVIPKKKVVPLRPKVQVLDLSKKIEVLSDDIPIQDIESLSFEEMDDLNFGMDEEEQYFEGSGVLNLEGLFTSKELSENPKFGRSERDLDLYIKSKLNLFNSGITSDVKVNVSFVIEKDGQISNVKIDDSKGLSYSALVKLKKLFEKMPPWSPGKFGSIPVRTQLVKPINIVFGG